MLNTTDQYKCHMSSQHTDIDLLINATCFMFRSLNHDAYLGYQYTSEGRCKLIHKGCGDIHQSTGDIVTYTKG